MLDFELSTPDEYIAFAQSLWHNRQQFGSHEEASQHLTRALYKELEPQAALVRVFRLTTTLDLPPDVQALVEADEEKVMALTGTYGMEPHWCDRHQSVGHKAIPLRAIAIPERIPMFQEVLTQMELDYRRLREVGSILEVTTKLAGQFYVPSVPDASYIPAQDEFVKPYEIASLVGFGGVAKGTTLSTVIYLLYVFTRVHVSLEAVERFNQMQPYIGTYLASQQDEPIFTNVNIKDPA